VNGHNIWEGKTVRGVTVLTLSRGKIVWEASVANGVAAWEKGTFSLKDHKGQYVILVIVVCLTSRFIARPNKGFAYESIKDEVRANIARK
jgi:hypothetical protein